MNAQEGRWLKATDIDCLQRLTGYSFPQDLKRILIRVYGFGGQRMQWLKTHDRYSRCCGAWCYECQMCAPYRGDTVMSQIERIVNEYRFNCIGDTSYEHIKRQMDIRSGLIEDVDLPF